MQPETNNITPKPKTILALIDEMLGQVKQEFVTNFEMVVKMVKDLRESNTKEFDLIHKAVDKLSEDVKTEASNEVVNIRAQVTSEFNKAFGEQQKGMNYIFDKVSKLKNGKDGKDGENGVSIKGDPGQNGSPDTPIDVRDKLASLSGDDRLDASHIKNLPTGNGKGGTTLGAIHPPIWSLADVDVSGITAGQALKWDGIRWIPFTPSSTTTGVYNEVVSGSTSTFTLAHTPATGTLRVYAQGQRLLPTQDYTLSGDTITTGDTFTAGQIYADYEF